ncbi:hypothetical protein D3C81_545810 [compost metagenome]
MLDHLADGQADQGQRQESDGDIEHELARLRFAAEGGQHAADALAVFPAHGQDGAGLDGDLEDPHDFFRDILCKVEQAAGQDQMSRGRNRQEFGKTFDQPHDDGF